MRDHPGGCELARMSCYRLFDHVVDVFLAGDGAGGRCSVMAVRTPAGRHTPLHVHPGTDQVFFVIEGEQTLWVGHGVRVLRAGDCCFAPRGVPHAFKSSGASVLDALVISLPAGPEEFVRSYGSRASAPLEDSYEPPPDMAAAVAFARRSGIQLLGPAGMLPGEFPGKPSD
jgi:mannose-6-phosphate isomerase-like protein (cupin superfamily)